jgi:hypothetical protein
LCIKVTLTILAAKLFKRELLLLALDSLGSDVQSEGFGKSDYSFVCCGILDSQHRFAGKP